MTTRWVAILGMSAFLSGVSVAAAAQPLDMSEVPLTLRGCVVAGADDDSYLLTNVTLEEPTIAPSNAFYRFDSTDGLRPHVGRRVEVKGLVDLEDVDEAEMRVRTEDGRIRTEITSERRTVTLENAWFGSLGSVEIDAEVPSYKFDLKSVRLLEGNCASALVAQ